MKRSSTVYQVRGQHNGKTIKMHFVCVSLARLITVLKTNKITNATITLESVV